MHLYWVQPMKIAVQALKKGRLNLLSIDDLRNPFLRNGPMAQARQNTVSQDLYRTEMQSQYEALPSHIRGAISFDYFLDKSEPRRQEIEAIAFKNQSDGFPEDAVLYDIPKYQQLRILRLHSDICHLGIWQNQPKDSVAIQLNAEHSVFSSLKDNLSMLKPVSYGREKQTEATRDMLFPGVFCLPEELKYEQEWRLIKLARQQGDNPDELKFSKGLVEAVVMGPECELSLFGESWDWLKTDMRYKSVQRFSIRIDPYALELRKESY